MEFDALSRKVIGCAIDVHRELGPGLLESTYEQCLAYEMRENGLECAQQVVLPVYYKGNLIECGYRIDLLVENRLILELKCIDKILRIHEAQLLTYMKLAKMNTGLLINFNVNLIKTGIKRLVL